MYRKRKREGYDPYVIDKEARRQMLLDQYDPDQTRGSANSIQKYGVNWTMAERLQRRNRMASGFVGRGGYFGNHAKTWYGRAIGGAARAGGEYLGNMIGAGGIGRAAGGALSKWAGFGKYRRRRRRRRNFRGRGDYGGDAGGNQIMAGSVDTPITVNSNESDLSGDVYISHREFLGNVQCFGKGAGSTIPSDFNILAYPLNVGLGTSFPWLSQIAQNFTMYELQGCIYEFKPTSGEFGSSSNQLGKVVMATQYDPDAPAFISTVQMENYDYANACKPSETMLHGVETAISQRATNMLYVRTGTSVKDKTFTDIGTFYIATEGLPVNATAGTPIPIGELWVTYRVKLSRALLFGTILHANVAHDVLVAVSAAAAPANFLGASDTLVPVQIYGNNFVKNPQAVSAITAWSCKANNIGASIDVGPTPLTDLLLTFPVSVSQGMYRVTVYNNTNAVTTSSNLQWVPQAGSAVNCSLITAPTKLPSSLNYGTLISSGTSYIMANFVVQVLAPGIARASINIRRTVSAGSANVTASESLFIEICEFNTLMTV